MSQLPPPARSDADDDQFVRRSYEPTNDEVRQKLLERARRLKALQIHGVSTPLHVEERATGEVCVIERRLGDPLSGRLKPKNGLPRKKAEEVCRQLLAGLAALHAAGEIHGDIRPEHVYLVKRDGREFATLGGVVGGHLPYWTSGDSVVGNMQDYLPPEFSGAAREPTREADIFALGRVCQALFRGLDVFDSDRAERPVQGASKPLRKLLSRMTDKDPHQRPTNGVKAVKDFDDSQRRQSRVRIVSLAAAAAVLAVICVFLWRGREALRSELGRTETELENKQSDLEDTQNKLTAANDTANSLQREKEELQRQIASQSSDESSPPDAEALLLAEMQGFWRENSPGQDPFDDRNWNRLDSLIEERPEADRAQLREWFDVCESYRNLDRAWIECDRELKQAHARLAREPWNPVFVDAMSRQWDAVSEAARLWKEWGESPDINWSGLEGRVNDTNLDPDVGSVLRRWFDAFESHNPNWCLVLSRGHAGADYGTHRVAYVYVDGKASYGSSHDWPDVTSHTYSTESEERIVRFRWRPGENVRFILFGPRPVFSREPGQRYELIDYTCPGPVPIWILHGIRINGVDDDTWLVVDVEDCPGPPRSDIPGRPTINLDEAGRPLFQQ